MVGIGILLQYSICLRFPLDNYLLSLTCHQCAQYVAEAIADPEMANAALEIAGDVISMKQTLATYQQVTGKKLGRCSLSNVLRRITVRSHKL